MTRASMTQITWNEGTFPMALGPTECPFLSGYVNTILGWSWGGGDNALLDTFLLQFPDPCHADPVFISMVPGVSDMGWINRPDGQEQTIISLGSILGNTV